MAWQDEMTLVVRAMLGDLDGTKFTDDRLEQLLVIGARGLLADLPGFQGNFKVDVLNINITPDPTDDVKGTRDDNFVNLCCLKTCCIVDYGNAFVSAGQAISVKDGSSAVDLTKVSLARQQLLEKGVCKTYDDERVIYLSNSGIAGAAVMGPFRLYAYGILGDFTGYGGLARVRDFYPY